MCGGNCLRLVIRSGYHAGAAKGRGAAKQRISMSLYDPDDRGRCGPGWSSMCAGTGASGSHDPAGGFFESLDALGAPVASQRRRRWVQARLTYVFSHAYLLGGDPVFPRGRAARPRIPDARRARARTGAGFTSSRSTARRWTMRATPTITPSCCSRSPGIAARPMTRTRSSSRTPPGNPCRIRLADPEAWRLLRGVRAGPYGHEAAAPAKSAHASARGSARTACRNRREELAAPRDGTRRSVQAALRRSADRRADRIFR